MVHLDDLLVVIFAERLGGDLRQVKEKIHADGKVRREDDGNCLRGFLDRAALFVVMTCCANDECFSFFYCNVCQISLI